MDKNIDKGKKFSDISEELKLSNEIECDESKNNDKIDFYLFKE